MKFRDESTPTRVNGIAGTPAEQAFERYMGSIGRPVCRVGFDKVPAESGLFPTWDERLQNLPDYAGHGCLWEIMGAGSEQVVRVKKRKFHVQVENATYFSMPLRWALYDQPHEQIITLNMSAMLWAVRHPNTVDGFITEQNGAQKPTWIVPLQVFREIEVTDLRTVEKHYRG